MNDEQVKKIIDGPQEYDDSKENGYRSMVNEFYSRKMLSTLIIVWGHFLIFLALAVVSGVLFFKSDQTKDQIMYAAFFICCIIISYQIKIFAWLKLQENSIKREIKRLELRIAELSETVKNK